MTTSSPTTKNEDAKADRLGNMKDAYRTYQKDPQYIISKFLDGIFNADERMGTTEFTLIGILESVYLALGK